MTKLYPLLDSPDPAKTQSTAGTVLNSKTAHTSQAFLWLIEKKAGMQDEVSTTVGY